jgi:LytS/YehU family sensor histidine kinase
MDKSKRLATQNMIFAALFLALAYVLPFLTGQIPEIGSMLCPMHMPIILCGFIAGYRWGMAVGLTAPLLRSLTLGMPPLFPTAVCMSAELMVYGLVSGLLYKILPKKKLFIYLSLSASMLLGRVVWGLAMLVCLGIQSLPFTLAAFWTGAFVNAIPGIVIQIFLIPLVVILFEKTTLSEKKEGYE